MYKLPYLPILCEIIHQALYWKNLEQCLTQSQHLIVVNFIFIDIILAVKLLILWGPHIFLKVEYEVAEDVISQAGLDLDHASAKLYLSLSFFNYIRG